MELNIFQNEFQTLSNRFKENEKLLLGLKMSGSSLEEVNAHLDKLESVTEDISADAIKAKKLAKAGYQLISEHSFVRDSLEPKCYELKMMCKRQEVLFMERRQALLKFLDLYDALEDCAKWCLIVEKYFKSDFNDDKSDNDTLSNIRHIDYILSKCRDLRMKTRVDFEEGFDEIKDLISPKTLFLVDDRLELIDKVKQELIDRREMLRDSASKDPNITDACENSDDLAER